MRTALSLAKGVQRPPRIHQQYGFLQLTAWRGPEYPLENSPTRSQAAGECEYVHTLWRVRGPKQTAETEFP